MPTLYSRKRRDTETRVFGCRSPSPRSSRKTISFIKEHDFLVLVLADQSISVSVPQSQILPR